MTDKTTQKKATVGLPMSATDALEFTMNGRHIDYAALARLGDVVSGKPIASSPMPARSISPPQD